MEVCSKAALQATEQTLRMPAHVARRAIVFLFADGRAGTTRRSEVETNAVIVRGADEERMSQQAEQRQRRRFRVSSALIQTLSH